MCRPARIRCSSSKWVGPIPGNCDGSGGRHYSILAVSAQWPTLASKYPALATNAYVPWGAAFRTPTIG